jgi:16S rRNA (cytosine967-C5)-methyltransferase
MVCGPGRESRSLQWAVDKGKQDNAGRAISPPASAREAAARKLGDQAKRWPDFGLAPMLVDGLDDRDAALAHAIYDAGMRRWLTLEWLLDRFLEVPLSRMEPSLQGVLVSGAAQLVLFDRIPVHSAIDETVDLARKLVREGASGLCNAVLRKVAEAVGDRTTTGGTVEVTSDRLPLSDGGSVALKDVKLPEDRLSRLGIATSHPAWLLKRWAMRRPFEQVQKLALHSLVNAPTIVNVAYATEKLPGLLSAHGVKGSRVFTGLRSELSTLLESRRDLWVQDSASSRPIAGAGKHLDIRSGLIIDMCAGQGTKTRQLAAAFPGALIVATDTDDRRLMRLAETFAGDARVEVVRPQDVLMRFHGRADLVLLDVPCTNTGVLARRVEAKYRCDDEQLKRLVDIQKQVIADSMALIRSKPRGRILYSTCSLEPEENQSQADWASRWHSLKVIAFESHTPTGLPGEDAAGYADGAFWSLLG